MLRNLTLLACLAALTSCTELGWGPEPPGHSVLSQQTIHGYPPGTWSCITNREPTCQ